jgi:hypothetical protein
VVVAATVFGHQLSGFFLVLFDFIQIGLDFSHLVFELFSVLGQHGDEFFQLRHGIARLSYMSMMSLASINDKPKRLARKVKRNRARSLAL